MDYIKALLISSANTPPTYKPFQQVNCMWAQQRSRKSLNGQKKEVKHGQRRWESPRYVRSNLSPAPLLPLVGRLLGLLLLAGSLAGNLLQRLLLWRQTAALSDPGARLGGNARMGSSGIYIFSSRELTGGHRYRQVTVFVKLGPFTSNQEKEELSVT